MQFHNYHTFANIHRCFKEKWSQANIGSAGLQTYRTIVLTNAAAAAAAAATTAPAMLPNSKHKQS